jgi:hypothetical protein
MARNNSRLAPLLFILAGALFAIAAIIPMFRGERTNAAFIALGVVFLILGIAKLRRGRASEDRAT